MANWLGRAKSLFQPSPPPIESFEVECDCGAKVCGQRSSGFLKPACPSCKRPVFVLPSNVYPVIRPFVKAPSQKKDKDANPAKPSPKTVVKDVPVVRPAKPQAVEPAPQAAASPPVTAVPPKGIDPLRLREPGARRITPLRLVTAAIIVMGSLLIGGIWHRQSLETAKKIVTPANDAGIEAIAERDFRMAAIQFGRARDAVNLIGRHDSAANRIRINSREATAMSKLATSSLIDVLELTLASKKRESGPNLRMSNLHKGHWIIFDTRILPSTESKSRYTVDAPLKIDDVEVRVEIETSIFNKIPKLDETGEPSRVIFAAQLDGVSTPKGDPPTCVLTLTGKTAFLWSSFENYTAVGFRSFDEESERETRQILEQQTDAQAK